MVHDRIRTRDPWHASPSCCDHGYFSSFYNKFLKIDHFSNRSAVGVVVTSPFNNWKTLLTRVRTQSQPAVLRPGEIRIQYAMSINRDIDRFVQSHTLKKLKKQSNYLR